MWFLGIRFQLCHISQCRGSPGFTLHKQIESRVLDHLFIVILARRLHCGLEPALVRSPPGPSQLLPTRAGPSWLEWPGAVCKVPDGGRSAPRCQAAQPELLGFKVLAGEAEGSPSQCKVAQPFLPYTVFKVSADRWLPAVKFKVPNKLAIKVFCVILEHLYGLCPILWFLKLGVRVVHFLFIFCIIHGVTFFFKYICLKKCSTGSKLVQIFFLAFIWENICFRSTMTVARWL